MVEFYVKVETEASEFEVRPGNILEVAVESEASNGRANSELVRKLSETLGEKVGILQGHKSRRKKLKADLTEEQFDKKLEKH